jgi:tetratricopeptide (TPR) repeat protein
MALTHPEVPKVTVQKGLKYYEAGNYKEAEGEFKKAKEELEKVAQKRPLTKEEWTYKGAAHHKLGLLNDAINCFDEALELDRGYYKAWYNKALALQSLGSFSEALQCIIKALSIKPRSYKMLNTKGTIYDDMGMYGEALECYRQVINHKNEATTIIYNYALNNMAWTLANMGKYEDADCWAKKYLVDIDEAYALETRAFILLKLGKFDEAEKLLDQSLLKQDKDKYAWYHIGKVLYEKKKFDAAVRCYNKALEIDQTFAEAINDKAVALSAEELYDEASQELKRAISIRPSLVTAHENLIKLSFRDISRPTFWDFWKASQPRKITAILLGLAAVGLIIYGIYVFPQNVETKNLVYRESSIIKSNTTTVSTQPPNIPQSYLIIIGLIALILLSPIIRSAKAGPFEFTLIETDRRVQPLNTV